MTTSACSTRVRNVSLPAVISISMETLRMLRVNPANSAVVRTPDGSYSADWWAES